MKTFNQKQRRRLKNSLDIAIYPIKNSNMVNIVVTKGFHKVEAGKFSADHVPSLLVMFSNWSKDYIDLQIEKCLQTRASVTTPCDGDSE